MDEKQIILQARNIYKSYRMDLVEVPVLKGVTLEVCAGEFLAIVGASGSGKSTLLHIFGALDRPDRGKVIFDHTDVFEAEESRRNELRNRCFGFVFQFYHLLPELTVLENVLMPVLVGSNVLKWPGTVDRSEQEGLELLGRLGLGERAYHLPSQLSGGERQRAAIGRAMINKPDILLADEPTGNLDAVTGRQILELLLNLHQAGQTIVMVTHDSALARSADRLVRLHDGKIVPESVHGR